MDFFTPEYFNALLSPQAQASLTEKIIIVGVVWATMGRKVSKRFKEFQSTVDATLSMFRVHLTAIEEKFDKGIAEMRAMKDAVSKDLQVNSQRLSAVENGLTEVKTRVGKLETK